MSQIRAPFTQQPFTQQPFTQQPFTQQPFTQQPFTQQPFTQQPFTQQSNPSDPVNSNSTFYLAPSPTPGQSASLRLPGGDRADSVVARQAGGATLTPVRLHQHHRRRPTTGRDASISASPIRSVRSRSRSIRRSGSSTP